MGSLVPLKCVYFTDIGFQASLENVYTTPATLYLQLLLAATRYGFSVAVHSGQGALARIP